MFYREATLASVGTGQCEEVSCDLSHNKNLSNQDLQCRVVIGKPTVGVVAAITSHIEAGSAWLLQSGRTQVLPDDAPSKEVELLTEELGSAKRNKYSISCLKRELQRQQKANHGDSIIYELAEPDYSPGNSIMTQVVMMKLQNELYHTEKDKKMEGELKVVEQHVDHYQTKAKEWKVKATRLE
ncbi:hypothetical protein E2C01_064505 [Portunus trituberculatus]|uniref:Uncharacterized protein n=1 Tax=Portunus trituberculatus TaxID=210409 RepID=A0A5B7HJA4_PORTR|nr:hypothetical protein [Portunus trituberculatus]